MSVIDKIFAEEKYTLSKPIRVGEEEIAELSLPFSELRGRDIADAQTEFEVMKGGLPEMCEMEKDFQALMVARLAKVPFTAITEELSVRDYTVLTLTMYRFFFHGV